MALESKNKSLNEIARDETSPGRKVPKSENQASQSSKDPRYLSPIHSKQDTSDSTKCLTCDKRQTEKPDIVYHASPPKIRPSHHVVLCEDCSEGSYSKVLKIVCLNEEEAEKTGTKKVKVIESAPQVLVNKPFPVIGKGNSVQVHYQEVYPPPKQEITSMIPESYRENGVLNYQLKEEERKRVAIRRAEYSNRIKGVKKTIVTNIGGFEREEVGENTSVLEIDQGIDEKDNRICDRNHIEIIEEKKNEVVRNPDSGKEEELYITDIKNLSSFSQKNREKSKERAREKNSYLKKIQQETKDQSKTTSVKHRILAQLAGKDFSHLLKPGKIEDELESEEEEIKPKNRVEKSDKQEDEIKSAERDNEISEKLNIEADEIGGSNLNESSFENLEKNNLDDGLKSYEEDPLETNHLPQTENFDSEKSKTRDLEIQEETHNKNIEPALGTKKENENQADELNRTLRSNEILTSNPEPHHEHSKTSKFLPEVYSETASPQNMPFFSPRFISDEQDLLKSANSNNSPKDSKEQNLDKASSFKNSSQSSLSEKKITEACDSQPGGSSFQAPDPPNPGQKNKSEENLRVRQMDQMFMVLCDPQVIKGLKLLGGFAEYLEKNGKDVLNWSNR